MKEEERHEFSDPTPVALATNPSFESVMEIT